MKARQLREQLKFNRRLIGDSKRHFYVLRDSKGADDPDTIEAKKILRLDQEICRLQEVFQLKVNPF